MGRRILNDALRAIVNAERRGKASVELRPISTVMSSFLKIMKDRGNCVFSAIYKNFQVQDPHRVGRITVELQGRIKDCRALTYRQDIKAKDIEAYRLRILPTRQYGYVVITNQMVYWTMKKQLVGMWVVRFLVTFTRCLYCP
ncbi:hypothetical protein GH714_026643 [Hevea brasiliensis]|uniref:30S ribosomal protein S8, chloroplastic n=1 Tax=Hevea brasiliensis TaxID=3981 RepID=A0A6A6LU77_HEVBR|nr:hypothetical protein GH714_026643 [Hevea brasiliensis]